MLFRERAIHSFLLGQEDTSGKVPFIMVYHLNATVFELSDQRTHEAAIKYEISKEAETISSRSV